ncbi:MAG: translation initiation factor IF-2 [bacterium]
MKKENNKIKTDNRPPVVVILGHVDHGKTSILDYIRKTKVAARESGGITQHIGAYQIEHQNKKITFIDTPGHEAFSAMRGRGAQIADIAILVIAAEEGLKPQTKEAIQHIQKIGMPSIVAFNKIDKPEAQPEKVKNELTEAGVLVESRGGDIPSIEVSAQTGQGIDELLEMINLISEMQELKSTNDLPAIGVVVESYQDDRKGPTATVIVKEGILKTKDIIGTNTAFGKIKSLADFQLNSIDEASTSTPAVIIGFNQVPQVGEQFKIFDSIEEAEEYTKKELSKKEPEDESAETLDIEEDKKVLNIILKSDVHGSLEAIRESLKNIPSGEVVLQFLRADVGNVNEADIKTAEMSKAIIVAFRVKVPSAVGQTAQRKNISISTFNIIYELIQNVREKMSQLLEPEVITETVGKLKILAIFKTDKNRQVIGGRVIDGIIKKGTMLNIVRNGQFIEQGKLIQLQRDKKETNEVSRDQECGVLVESSATIEKGDVLEFYTEEKKKREI